MRIRPVLALGFFACAGFVVARCGQTTKHAEGDDEPGAEPTPGGSDTPPAPDAWDGREDWSESAFEVIDE